MAKHDAVDELMRLATQEKTMGASGAKKGEAEQVLEAQVARSEPGLPAEVPGAVAGRPATPASVQPSARVPAAPASAPVSGRGRDLLKALGPLLPAMSGALRMVDHGGVQAVARLLPLLGTVGSRVAAGAAAREPVLEANPAVSDGRLQALSGELRAVNTKLEVQEEQLRRMRESLERTVAEQGSLQHGAHQLGDRVRLLTASVVILLMLVVALVVLVAVYLHR